MTLSILYLPKAVSRDDRLAALRARLAITLGAVPTFRIHGSAHGYFSSAAHETFSSAATDMSPLSGMIPMYVLMSAFHFTHVGRGTSV
jgi:hypothetical protein